MIKNPFLVIFCLSFFRVTDLIASSDGCVEAAEERKLFIVNPQPTENLSIGADSLIKGKLQCQGVHFYKIQNPNNGALIYLLGSMHILNLSVIPEEAIDVLLSADALFTELGMYKKDKNGIRLGADGAGATYDLIEHKETLVSMGLYRNSDGVGFLDKLIITEAEKLNLCPDTKISSWSDVFRSFLTPKTVKDLDNFAVRTGYKDMADRYKHFHPSVLKQVFCDIEELCLEDLEGMDIGLTDRFVELKKPIHALESEQDRDRESLKSAWKSELSGIQGGPSFTMQTIRELAEIVNDAYEILERRRSVFEYFEEDKLSRLRDRDQAAKYLDDLIKYRDENVCSYYDNVEKNLKASEIDLKNAIASLEAAKLDGSANNIIVERGLIYQLNEQSFILKNQEMNIAVECHDDTDKKIEAAQNILNEAQVELEESVRQANLPTIYLKGEIFQDLITIDPIDPLVLRNNNWMPKLLEILNHKSLATSVVVGAGHLYGPYGLLYMLSNLNFKITRWDQNADQKGNCKDKFTLEDASCKFDSTSCFK